VAEATGNRFFVATLAALQAQIALGITLNRNLSLIQPRDRILTGQREHKRIVEAIAAKDETGARAAMRWHIENARKRVFDAG
jgi:DNA-binding FadR family transcriptional regulator